MAKYRLIFTLSDGSQITAGEFEVPKGSVPIKGVDYFTEEDKKELIESALEQVDFEELTTKVTDLEKAIADLNYKAIAISSFSASPSTAEMGSTVSSVALSWGTNKTPAALTLDGEGLDASTKETVVTRNLTENKTWTLKATDERGAAATKVASLTFLNGVYYGAAAEPSAYDSAFVLTLTKTLRSTKLASFSANAASGQYIYYCLPKRMGTCAFNVGGFDGGFSLIDTISFTNASGYTEEYYVYRSDNASLGQTDVKVS